MVAASIFSVNNHLPDPVLDAKWYYTGYIFVGGGIVLLLLLWKNNKTIDYVNISPCIEYGITIICSLEGGITLLRMVGLNSDANIGLMDNTAGVASCLCLSLPMGNYQLKEMDINKKVFFIICKLLCVITLICIGSRTGVLIVLLLSIIIGVKNRRKRILMFIGLILVGVILSFSVKKESAMGRWFIIQRSAEMIAQNPIRGWGANGFISHYMDFQANYFEQNPNSEYVMLADNIHHPLNEFLLITVNYGFMGLVLLILMIGGAVYYINQIETLFNKTKNLIFICIIALSLFSYPFFYPFTWVIIFSLIFCFFNQIGGFSIYFRKPIIFILLISISIFGVQINEKRKAETHWCKASKKVISGKYSKALPNYSFLYNSLKNDYMFLYNYASTLHIANRQREALTIATDCYSIYSDYDLSLLIADIYRDSGCYYDAITWYSKTHHMCPSRFIPLYELYIIYRKLGDKKKTFQIAKQICNMPMKIPSSEIKWIKKNVESDFPKGITGSFDYF